MKKDSKTSPETKGFGFNNLGVAVATEFGFRPLYCPFISHIDKYKNSPGYDVQFFNCMGEKCQLWNKKKRDCGLLRNIEYETLLEKILEVKK